MENLLEEAGKNVSELFQRRANRFHFSSLMVKSVLVAGGAAVATIAQFIDWPQEPSPSQIIGIAASIIVFLGGLFVVFTESDASKELASAQEALRVAENVSKSQQWVIGLVNEFERLIELMEATRIMTELMQQETLASVGADVGLAERFVSLTGRSLAIASGFELNDRWTICIYKAEKNEQDQTRLRCIAHRRAIECNIEQAREWEVGKGVAGVCYSTKSPQIIPDMSAPELQNMLSVGYNPSPMMNLPIVQWLHSQFCHLPMMCRGE